MAEIFREKQIPAWVDFWGHDVDHDWPFSELEEKTYQLQPKTDGVSVFAYKVSGMRPALTLDATGT